MNLQNFLPSLIPWFLSHGIRIIFTLIAAFLANWFLKVFIEKMVKRAVGNRMREANRKRTETLIGVLGGTLSFVIWITAILMILPEFGVNIAPILAGLGLAGLAVGMAARDIISDFISGLFILLEGQYYVGDKIKISGIEGVVEEITLRRTIIRDDAGFLHAFPNSQIRLVSKKER